MDTAEQMNKNGELKSKVPDRQTERQGICICAVEVSTEIRHLQSAHWKEEVIAHEEAFYLEPFPASRQEAQNQSQR